MPVLLLVLFMGCRATVESELNDRSLTVTDPIAQRVLELEDRIAEESRREDALSQPSSLTAEQQSETRKALSSLESASYRERRDAETSLLNMLRHPDHFFWASNAATSPDAKRRVATLFTHWQEQERSRYPACPPPKPSEPEESFTTLTSLDVLYGTSEFLGNTCSETLTAYRDSLQKLITHRDHLQSFVAWLSARTQSRWTQSLNLDRGQSCCLSREGKFLVRSDTQFSFTSDVIISDLEIANLCATLHKENRFPGDGLSSFPFRISFKKDPSKGASVIPRCAWRDRREWILHNPDQDWR